MQNVDISRERFHYSDFMNLLAYSYLQDWCVEQISLNQPLIVYPMGQSIYSNISWYFYI